MDPSGDSRLLFLPRAGLQRLLDILRDRGHRCIGPRVRDGAIVYDTLNTVDQLPAGWRDEQAPGRYTLTQSGDARLFAWANGPQAIKPLTFAPQQTLWKVERDSEGVLRFSEVMPAPERLALIAVRACDLAALRVQDRVFLGSAQRDPYYAAHRQELFLVAVNCSHPAATCFCVSAGDGPRARQGFDLSLTELDDGFVVEVGSAAGHATVQPLHLTPASDEQHYAAGRQHADAVHAQQRTLPPVAERRRLMQRLNDARWDDVASRCLSCGNCTQVCPTCFCHAEEDHVELDGVGAAHVRQWDSCFTQQHSYMHGFTLRQDTRLRYRQWLTHKLASWHEQFDSSGCVGCGRCITWCPAGIDMTQEAHALCEQEAS